MTAREMKHLATAEKWKEIIQQCRSEGGSVKKWCAEHGICFGTYYRWEREIFRRVSERSEGGSSIMPYFAEVPAVAVSEKRSIVATEEKRSATVRLDAGTIDVYAGADPETIRTLINLLRHAE